MDARRVAGGFLGGREGKKPLGEVCARSFQAAIEMKPGSKNKRQTASGINFCCGVRLVYCLYVWRFDSTIPVPRTRTRTPVINQFPRFHSRLRQCVLLLSKCTTATSAA